MARMVLEKGASLAIVDERNWTPLHTACVSNNLDVCLLFLEHNAPVNAKRFYRYLTTSHITLSHVVY